MEAQDRIVSDIDMARPRIIEDVIAVAYIFSEVDPMVRPMDDGSINVQEAKMMKKIYE